jgi:pimeloyl-ACP methyl ester carboxylesterase
MYLRDSRAIDYIASRPDWDGKTIVIMGTSMGGQQSLVTAALNPKVTAVIVNEPSGADSNGNLHGRKAGYPNWPSSDAKVMETALYFDTVNFAPHQGAGSRGDRLHRYDGTAGGGLDGNRPDPRSQGSHLDGRIRPQQSNAGEAGRVQCTL